MASKNFLTLSLLYVKKVGPHHFYNRKSGPRGKKFGHPCRTIYYEALDAIINSIKERFDQESVQVFASIKSLLLKSIYLPGETNKELEEYKSKFYGDEIDLVALKIETNVLRTIIKDKVACFKDIYQVVKDCSEGERGLMPNIIHAIKLLLVNP